MNPVSSCFTIPSNGRTYHSPEVTLKLLQRVLQLLGATPLHRLRYNKLRRRMACQLCKLLVDVQIPQRIKCRLRTSRDEDLEKVGGGLVANEEAKVVGGGGPAVGVLG